MRGRITRRSAARLRRPLSGTLGALAMSELNDRHARVLGTLLAAWVLVGAGQAEHRAESSPRTLAVTRPAASDADVRPDLFTFSVDRLEYSVTAQGHGRCSDGRSAPRQFTLPLTRGARIERLWYLALGQDLYLIYEDEDSESGAGTVARLLNDLRPS